MKQSAKSMVIIGDIPIVSKISLKNWFHLRIEGSDYGESGFTKSEPD